MKRRETVVVLLVTLVLVVSMVMALPVMASQCETIKIVEPETPNMYYVGDTIHYVMNVTNPVGNPYTNNYTSVKDTLPDGTTEVTLATNVIQAPGVTDTYTYDYVVNATHLEYLAGRWRVINTVHVEGIDTHGDYIDDTKSWNSIILRPAISITKTVDFNGDGAYTDLEYNLAGQNASWNITVCNTGFDPVYNITVTDTNGHNFGAAFNLTVGECKEFIYDLVVDADTVNTATAQGEDELGNPVGPVQDPAEVVTTPPQEVGGTAFLVNKWGLLAPWALLLGCALVVTLLMLRKRRQA